MDPNDKDTSTQLQEDIDDLYSRDEEEEDEGEDDEEDEEDA